MIAVLIVAFSVLVAGALLFFSSELPATDVSAAPIYASAPTAAATLATIENGVQKVSVRALGTGRYDHPQITVVKGVPVELSFSAEPSAGCGHQFVMRDFGVSLSVQNGETKTARFTPTQAGNFEYSCAMRMFRGTLTVIEGN